MEVKTVRMARTRVGGVPRNALVAMVDRGRKNCDNIRLKDMVIGKGLIGMVGCVKRMSRGRCLLLSTPVEKPTRADLVGIAG